MPSTELPHSGLRAHPIIGNKVPASQLQELTIARVIDRFDADDARRDCGRVCLQMLEEFQLGGGRADDQDFTGILYRVGDLLVVGMILGARPEPTEPCL